jgi:hypothetical protein
VNSLYLEVDDDDDDDDDGGGVIYICDSHRDFVTPIY